MPFGESVGRQESGMSTVAAGWSLGIGNVFAAAEAAKIGAPATNAAKRLAIGLLRRARFIIILDRYGDNCRRVPAVMRSINYQDCQLLEKPLAEIDPTPPHEFAAQSGG